MQLRSCNNKKKQDITSAKTYKNYVRQQHSHKKKTNNIHRERRLIYARQFV